LGKWWNRQASKSFVHFLPRAVRNKIPGSWGRGAANKKGIGWRWQDPANSGNGIRIDAGNIRNPQTYQQVDHVVVRRSGQIIGRDGNPISGSLATNPEAHIPVSEWAKWATWFAP
jgi:hypothetical protein